MDLKKVAEEVFKVVETDLRDRKGIRHEWAMVDEDIQQEIRDTNQQKILEVLEKYLPKK